MENLRETASAVLITAALGALSACAGPADHPTAAKTAALPPDRGLIVFAAETVGEAPKRRVQYADNEQRVDYALYRGGGAQAEFAYMETPYNRWLAFEFPYTVRDKVEAWEFNKGRAIEWKKAVKVRTPLGLIFYRRYRLTGAERSCFGMSGEWDRAVEDPDQRHTRIMFGYYCAPAGKDLSDREALSLVNRIGLRGTTVKPTDYAEWIRDFYGDVERSFGGPGKSARAIELARGAAGPEPTGIDEFPFDYVEHFSPATHPP